MIVFWIEGLPGSGKTTLIKRLQTELGESAVFIPKIDIPSFFKMASFDYRPFFSLGHETDIAMERLKTSILNGAKSETKIIGERSYLSTCVYYSILQQENLINTQVLEQIIDNLFNNHRKYEERFIYLDCHSDESISRDLHSFSGFWKNKQRLEIAKRLYLYYFKKFPSNHVCFIPRGTQQSVFQIAREFIHD